MAHAEQTTRPGRRSIRLPYYDYTRTGAYFVTLCTLRRVCAFGHVVRGKMVLNGLGCIVADTWRWLEVRYPYVRLDEWIVMPNHMHGIVVVDDDIGAVGGRKPLGRLIGAFKTVSTKRINQMRNVAGLAVWQRNYYEHIIRDDQSLNRIRRYIVRNPANWGVGRRP